MALSSSSILYKVKHQSCSNRCVVLDSSTESALNHYVENFVSLNISVVVRCCQPTYDPKALLDHGIKVVDLPFEDDGVPSPSVIDQWLDLANDQNTVIAVYCISGLKRVPGDGGHCSYRKK
ncbi:Protein tyrosine phosphatase type IVA 1, partial [Rhizopus azygosporus]